MTRPRLEGARLQTAPVVGDGEDEGIALATQFKADRRRRRVLQGIGHRLLGDHAQVMHHRGRQRRQRAVDPYLQRRHTVARQATDDFFQLGGQVEAIGAGGLSGAPLTGRSRAFVADLYRRSGGRIPIVGVGGIMNADDAIEMLRAGATAVQVYTGFIYGGPAFAAELNAGIARYLEGRGLERVEQIVGEAAR